MAGITREQLAGYLDDALGETETAQVEQALRASAALRQQLQALLQEGDRGEHSLGAIWRRQRLTCPSREQLGSFLLGALEPEIHDYVDFHLRTIACSFCLANLADLQTLQQKESLPAQQRRQRLFTSSHNLLKPARDVKK